ncbi:MAG: serine/threonine-protein kinase [Limnospira sp.]
MRRSKYRILGWVGQGQYGQVYCGSDRKTGQLVALKELSHRRSPTSQFLQELWYIISLQHPNIAACLGLEHIETGRYLVMDYCEGGTLRRPLEGDRSLRLLESLQIVADVLKGLDYAHQRGVIHCDIKPENILLTARGPTWQPKLTDFGIARRLPASGDGNRAIANQPTGGSPAYMAPERFYGLYSPQSDLYAVGVVLYELLVGDRPFHGIFNELMSAHMNHRIELPAFLPESLQKPIKKSLEKLPARRFPTAGAMAQALAEAIADPEVRAIGDRLVPWIPDDSETESPPPDDDPTSPRVTSGILKLKSFPQNPETPDADDSPIPPTEAPPLLVSSPGYLYRAIGPNVAIRSDQTISPSQFSLPEPVLALYPLDEGCCILTRHHLYRWHPDSPHIRPLLDFRTVGKRSRPPLDPPPEPRPETVAIAPNRHYFALALRFQLRFYPPIDRLRDETTSPLPPKPLKILSVSTEKLPKLTFLDRRHLLATWSNSPAQPPKTLFQIYSRRGIRMGQLKLPISVNRVLATPRPHTILALSKDSPSLLYQIHLKPLHLIRVFLESPPTCFFVADWGYGWADADGNLRIVNWDGRRIGEFHTSPVPSCIAPWGKTGLAIVTNPPTWDSIQILDHLDFCLDP